MAEPAELSSVWRQHLAKLGSKGQPKDLYERLRSGGTSHAAYARADGQFTWLEQSSTSVPSLPKIVLDLYQNRPQVCFFDVLPEINQAWASIDNTLFMWRLGDKEPVPVVFNRLKQPICAVGLVKVKKGIFMASFQYALVVCTPVEAVMVGVTFSKGTIDSEVALTPFPNYSISTDNVAICDVCATDAGRIYLGGSDSHLYELVYDKYGRCKKVCCTSSFLSMLGSMLVPTYISDALGGKPSPVMKVIVDEHRHYMYTLCRNSSITAFHLGKDGSMAPQELARVPDFLAAARNASGGSTCFRESNKTQSRVLHIAVIPPWVSTSLHMVAVTADARRVFFETRATQRQLLPRIAWSNDGLTGSAGRGQAAAGNSAMAVRPTNVKNASTVLYAANTLLVAEQVSADGSLSQLLAALPNLAVQQQPRAGAVIVSTSPTGSPQELVAEAVGLVPGEINVIAELRNRSAELYAPLLKQGLADEALLQLLLPPPRFAVMSTAGMLELTRSRPIDVFKSILDRNSQMTLLAFFDTFGHDETCCLCFCLASRAGAPGAVLAATAKRAEACLSDTRLAGTPEWPAADSDWAAGTSATPATSFGSMATNAEPEWSHMHRGLALFLSRLLGKVWKRPLLQTIADGKSIGLAYPDAMLAALEMQLRNLHPVIVRVLDQLGSKISSSEFAMGSGGAGPAAASFGALQNTKRQRVNSAFRAEHQKILTIAELALHAAQALLLVRKLKVHHPVRLLQESKPNLRTTLELFSLDHMLSASGRTRVTELLMKLLKGTVSGGGDLRTLGDEFLNGCPDFFPHHTHEYVTAFQALQTIGTGAMSKSEKEAVALSFVETVGSRLAAVADLKEVAAMLRGIDMYESIVRLAVAKADALYPQSPHLERGEEGVIAAAKRETVLVPVAELALELARDGPALTRVLQAAAAANDKVLQHLLFRELLQKGHGALLVKCAPNDVELERHLLTLGAPRPYTVPWDELGRPLEDALEAEQLTQLRLLSEVYLARQAYLRAADVLEALGSVRVADSVPPDARPDRAACMENAMLHAISAGSEGKTRELKRLASFAKLQKQVQRKLEQSIADARSRGVPSGAAAGPSGAPAPNDLAELLSQAAELAVALQSPSTLFNDYAVKYRMWDVCILLMYHTQHRNPDEIRQAWDLLLLDLASGPNGLERATTTVQDIASSLYPSPWFPLGLVLQRLLQMLVGLWPEGPSGGAAVRGGDEMVDACLCAVVGTDTTSLLYEFQQQLCCTASLAMSPQADVRLARSEAAWQTLLLVCERQLRSLMIAFQSADQSSDINSLTLQARALRAQLDTFVAHASTLPQLQGQGRKLQSICEELQAVARHRNEGF